MNVRLLAAACGLAASLVLSAPASAATITYDLSGDTNAINPSHINPELSFLDLTTTGTGSGLLPGYTLNLGDTIHVTFTLNHPVTLGAYFLFLLDTADINSKIAYNPSYSYFLGGAAVSPPGWFNAIDSSGDLGFGGQDPKFAPNFTFDQVVVDAVITSITDPSNQPLSSIDLLETQASVTFINATANVATTPLPGALLLMSTALGGLGIFARGKRAAAVS
jgi:hypothetical protein